MKQRSMHSEREALRLLLLSPNWLGDAVMALPALADVRRHFAAARLVVAARASVAPLYAMVPGVDEVVTLQWRGTLARRAAMAADVARLAVIGAELAILLPNSFGSAWLAKSAGISERWGYASDLRRPLLTRAVRRPRHSQHQAAYYQALVRALGIPSGPLEATLQVAPQATEAARALLIARGWDGVRPIVAIAPGAAYGTAKRWLPSHFATLIGMMSRERQVQCVLLGSAADADTIRWITSLAGAGASPAVIDLAGATSLEMLAAILGLAQVCVSNDSGAMHLAGAVGAPLAALFGPTREYETAPLTRPGGRSDVLINPVWCRPCMLRECPLDHRCMKGLLPEQVFGAVTRLMEPAP
jgi:heptosyltransferase-2